MHLEPQAQDHPGADGSRRRGDGHDRHRVVRVHQAVESAVDRSLDDAASHLRSSPSLGDPDIDGDGTVKPGNNPSTGRPRSFEQVLLQVIDSHGNVVLQPRSGALPIGSADKQVASSTAATASAKHDIEFDGEPFRVYTVKFGDVSELIRDDSVAMRVE